MKFSWNFLNKNEAAEEQTKDYTKMSQDQLLNEFQSSNWEKLDTDNRLELIQEMENRNAEMQGREPATVVSSSSLGSYGSYNNMSNQIRINVSEFSSYETLDTYIHESNHAYQHACIENQTGYDQHMLDMMQAETARTEEGQLYNYARMSPQYDMQCNELDSNNKAAAYLMAQSERYGNDPAYREYIAERYTHFQDVNTALSLNENARNTMQTNQANEAFARGDISEEQKNGLTENIQNENYEDAAVQGSYATGEALEALHNEYTQEAENAAENDMDAGCDNDMGDDIGGME